MLASAPTPFKALLRRARSAARWFGLASATAALWLAAVQAQAQVPTQPAIQPPAPQTPAPPVPAQAPTQTPSPANALHFPGPRSALDTETFYQLLLAEFKFQRGDPGGAHSLMLDAAVRLQRPELFRRAIEMALQNRAGNSAFNAALDWSRALPNDSEALRFQFQILLAQNRTAQLCPVLQRLIELAEPERRTDIIAAIPATLARLSDQPAALQATRCALQAALADAATAATAHATIGRIELQQGSPQAALLSAQTALQMQPDSVHGAALALALLERGQRAGETLLRAYLERQEPEGAAARNALHLSYVRALIDLRRVSDANQALRTLTQRAPELAQAWLLLGILQTQARRTGPAQAALERFLQLAPALPAEQRQLGQTQAWLHLAQLAELRRDFAAAHAWLDRIDPEPGGLSLHIRRAHLLARQGQLEQARALLRQQPERDDADARRKLLAEAQLLRELGHYDAALQAYGQALQRFPDDPDLLYEKALTAKRAGQYEAMEQLLRLLIERHPDYHHAYNALGYSLADRNVRLHEARSLIQKALAVDPNDAYILDSLGWVEFRLGNTAEALRLLHKALERLPDAVIAAHLGEVYWALGQREQALAAWRKGLEINPEDETLRETLQRLQVQP